MDYFSYTVWRVKFPVSALMRWIARIIADRSHLATLLGGDIAAAERGGNNLWQVYRFH